MSIAYSSVPDTTIIVAQYGGSAMTISCLQSIRHHEKTNWPMIVIDDGSPIKDRNALVETEIENTTLIFQEHRYLTAAWNCAAKLCQTRFLVFLNNDVTVYGDFVERLVAPLNTEETKMTGVRFRQENAIHGEYRKHLPTTRFLEGWCFAMKKTFFDRLGGFDPKMKLYFSDTDLQLRMVEATGSLNSLKEVRDLPLKHLGHRTAHRLKNRNAIWQKDRRVFLERWNEFGKSIPVAAQRELRPPFGLETETPC